MLKSLLDFGCASGLRTNCHTRTFAVRNRIDRFSYRNFLHSAMPTRTSAVAATLACEVLQKLPSLGHVRLSKLICRDTRLRSFKETFLARSCQIEQAHLPQHSLAKFYRKILALSSRSRTKTSRRLSRSSSASWTWATTSTPPASSPTRRRQNSSFTRSSLPLARRSPRDEGVPEPRRSRSRQALQLREERGYGSDGKL